MRALTHSSHVHEAHRVPVDPGDLAQLSNEQFEFLGDCDSGLRHQRRVGAALSPVWRRQAIAIESAPGQRQSSARSRPRVWKSAAISGWAAGKS